MWGTPNTIWLSHQLGHNQTATKEIRLFLIIIIILTIQNRLN